MDAEGCRWVAHRTGVDSEGAAVDVAGLCALGVHQERCSSKVADEHAFPGSQQAAQIHTHPATICQLSTQYMSCAAAYSPWMHLHYRGSLRQG